MSFWTDLKEMGEILGNEWNQFKAGYPDPVPPTYNIGARKRNVTGESGPITGRGQDPVDPNTATEGELIRERNIAAGGYSKPSSEDLFSQNQDAFLRDLFSTINANQLELARENNAASLALWEQQKNFNHDEALLERQWQEDMSNTAHQREAADLRAAGFNPVLTAISGGMGQGASSGTGATASASSPQAFGAQSSQTAELVMALFTGLSKIISSVKK